MDVSVLEPTPAATPIGSLFGSPSPQVVEVGAELFRDVEVALPPALRTYGGQIRATAVGNSAGRPIVVLGGISGNRFVCRRPDGSTGWWPGLVGHGQALDPALDLIVGIDFAADPTGRGAPSTADQARVLAAALDALGIERVEAIVGASYGGMVALAFAELFPDRTGRSPSSPPVPSRMRRRPPRGSCSAEWWRSGSTAARARKRSPSRAGWPC
jgi:pimeloyl-ACP methyl ester carboxylesterase